jgi:putative ABC transport system ATP-binding protein
VARRRVQPQAADAFDLAALELDALGLSDLMHRRPAALTPDARRLVLIARALVGRRRLVVVEQPETDLSPTQITAVRLSLWTAAALHGCCVLMTTGHPRLAASANRSVPLHGAQGSARWTAAS